MKKVKVHTSWVKVNRLNPPLRRNLPMACHCEHLQSHDDISYNADNRYKIKTSQ